MHACAWLALAALSAFAAQLAYVAWLMSFQKPFAFAPTNTESAAFAARMRAVPRKQLSQAELDFYGKHRYVVVREVVPKQIARMLFQEVAANASTPWYWRYHFSGVLSLARFQNWRADPILRELIFRSPLLPAVHKLMDSRDQIRLLSDHLEGLCPSSKGISWHTDIESFSLFSEKSKGQLVSTWCPLWDDQIEPELNENTGGLLYVQNPAQLAEACVPRRSLKAWGSADSLSSSPECRYEDSKVALHMALGDCVIFADDALHRTAPFNQTKLTQRYALVSRMFRSDAKPAKASSDSSSSSSSLVFPHAACSVCEKKPDQLHGCGKVNLHSSCFPQIYPKMLVEEVRTFNNCTFDPWQQLDPLMALHGWKVFLGLPLWLGMQ